MATVLVGCKLPHGIVIEYKGKSVTLDGLNKSSIIGADHMATSVDEGFWNGWLSENKEFAPVKSGAIFSAGNEQNLKAKAKEAKDIKTGFEQTPQDAGVIAA